MARKKCNEVPRTAQQFQFRKLPSRNAMMALDFGEKMQAKQDVIILWSSDGSFPTKPGGVRSRQVALTLRWWNVLYAVWARSRLRVITRQLTTIVRHARCRCRLWRETVNQLHQLSKLDTSFRSMLLQVSQLALLDLHSTVQIADTYKAGTQALWARNMAWLRRASEAPVSPTNASAR